MNIDKLPAQQHKIMQTIISLTYKHQRPPTYEEISDIVGIDTRGLGSRIKALKDKGFLIHARGVRLPDSQFLSPSEAAHALGISRSTINAWFTQGLISTVKTPGGRHLVNQSEIERLNKERELPQFGREINPDPAWCWWLVGFTDGEGTFSLTGNKRKSEHMPSSYVAKYQLFQRSDRRWIIEDVAATFQCGTIIDRAAKLPSGPGSYYIVQDMPTLLTIIVPFFDRYLPRMKYREYALWREAIMLKREGTIHLQRLTEIKEQLRMLYAFNPNS